VSGEGHAVELAAAIERLVEEARTAGTLSSGGGAAAAPEALVEPTGELAYPGKVAVRDDGARLAIADTGHDRVLVCTAAGEVLEELGGFYQPQGVRFDGDGLLVCETGADRVWRVDGEGSRRRLADGIASPGDGVGWRGPVVVAEAGRHRLRAIDRDGEAQVLAGSGAEGLHDGPALQAALAQPSGLAVVGGDLVFADAEASALRVLDAATLTVRTLVGTGLFAWGADDGTGDRAALQHPHGVAAAADGSLYVADTFNGLLRVWRGCHLWTVPVEGFAEPGGVDVLPDGKVVVADTGNHRVVLVDPVAAAAVALDVGSAAVTAETVLGAAGSTLAVALDLPLGGEELDVAAGAPVRVSATATDPGLLREPTSWSLDALPAEVELALGSGSGRVTVEVRAATCGADACRLRRAQRAYDVILT
jgi:DNA-binding beta-propeller fold protein YncE